MLEIGTLAGGHPPEIDLIFDRSLLTLSAHRSCAGVARWDELPQQNSGTRIGGTLAKSGGIGEANGAGAKQVNLRNRVLDGGLCLAR